MPEAWDPSEFHQFKVVQKQQISSDTVRVSFAPPSLEFAPLLSATCYFYAALPDHSAMRPYSPVSTKYETDRVEFVIKRYPEGKLSSFIFDLKPGDAVEMKGPLPKMLQYKPNMKKKLGLIGGGTGITPLLQILKAALNPPEEKDTTEFIMLYSNKSEDDILCKDILDQLVTDYCGRLTVKYFVTRANNPRAWQGKTGLIDQATIAEYMPKPSSDMLIAVCGPPRMMDAVSGQKDPKDYRKQGQLAGYLKELGYTEDMVFKF